MGLNNEATWSLGVRPGLSSVGIYHAHVSLSHAASPGLDVPARTIFS